MEVYDGEIDFAQSEPPQQPSELVPCSTCGRTFNPKALAKHAPICQRTTNNSVRRGTFKSSKQRDVAESDVPSSARKKNAQHKPAAKATAASKKKANWRSKHKEFVENIRAARKAQKIINEGGDISSLPPPKPSENPDYVKCQICSRRFNADAAERHVKFCEEQSKRQRIKKTATREPEALERMKRRTNYKPPSLRGRGSTSTPQRHRSAAQERPPRTQPPARPDTVASEARMPRPPPTQQSTKPNGRSARRAAASHMSGPGRPLSSTSSMNSSGGGASGSRPRSNVSFQDPGPQAPLLESRTYPFNRERQPPDDELLDRHRSNRQGSASSMGSSKSHRIGSAARPKHCGHCGELLHGSHHKKMFCTECGTRFTEQAKFCSMCGTRR